MRATASDASGKTAPSTGSVFVQLHLMRENDPTAKALVFSQFVGTIEWLKGKLREHGFGYRTISGSMPQKPRAKVVTVQQSSMLTLHVCCTHWPLLCQGFRAFPS